MLPNGEEVKLQRNALSVIELGPEQTEVRVLRACVLRVREICRRIRPPRPALPRPLPCLIGTAAISAYRWGGAGCRAWGLGQALTVCRALINPTPPSSTHSRAQQESSDDEEEQHEHLREPNRVGERTILGWLAIGRSGFEAPAAIGAAES